MKKITFALLSSALLAGCAASIQPTEVTSYDSPVESDTGIVSTHYHGIIGKYTHREPVDPRPWRKLNKEQTPKHGEGS